MKAAVIVRRRQEAAWLAASCLAFAGCGLSREKAPTRPPGAEQVSGTVSRGGTTVAAMKVKLYDNTLGSLTDSTRTGGGGDYGFSNVPAGQWMIKVSSSDTADLGYVRYIFDLSASGQAAAVPPFDVSAHGFDLVAPADGSTVPRPGFGSPLSFLWSAYQATYVWASARVSDSTGVVVWGSAAGQTTQAAWNGLGNSGPYVGQPAPPGRYTWRVKLRLPNHVQAASRERALLLQ